MDILDTHQRAQDAFAGVLANVTDAQLDAPTTCPEWKVRDLVGHVVAGNRRMGGLDPADLSTTAAGIAADHETSARAAQSAFAAPDGLTRTFEMPFGAVSGAEMAGLRSTDALTHAWDLARATGQPTDIEPQLAAQLLDAVHGRITDDHRGPGRPFGPAAQCASDAPAADRLAAYLGRSVG
ncbi:MAG: TIGR03086 family metal-binding protein [Acidimicrobiales bacterium]